MSKNIKSLAHAVRKVLSKKGVKSALLTGTTISLLGMILFGLGKAMETYRFIGF